jgi:multidrug efflux pump subunit AcrA (membrane-fusion protein)
MATRYIKGTLDTFQVDAGSDVTYVGNTSANSSGGINIRGFRVNPSSTGDIIVKIDDSAGVETIEIFQEDAYNAGSAPTGYTKFSNIFKSGKGGGAVAVTVTDASKDYIVLLTLDGYSEVRYTGSVVVP